MSKLCNTLKLSVWRDYGRNNGDGFKVAMNNYIRYLKEKESREKAERQRNALNERLRKAGLSEIPSWMGSAAMEGFLSGYESAEATRISNENWAKENGYSSYSEYKRIKAKARKDKKEYKKSVRKRDKAKKKYEKELEEKKKNIKASNFKFEIHPKDCNKDGLLSMEEVLEGCKGQKEMQQLKDKINQNINRRNWEEASKYSTILIELSNKLGQELTAYDYNQIAGSYRESKQLYKAISFYNKALEIDPLYPQSIGGLGTTKLYLGDVNGACEEWNKAINLEIISDGSKEHYSGLINKNCN